MRTERDHPAYAEIAREESLGIQAAPVRFCGRGPEASHDVQAAAHFVDEVGSAYLVVVKGEADVVRPRRKHTGRERRFLLTVEKLDLPVAVQPDVHTQSEARTLVQIAGRVGSGIRHTAAEPV